MLQVILNLECNKNLYRSNNRLNKMLHISEIITLINNQNDKEKQIQSRKMCL